MQRCNARWPNSHKSPLPRREGASTVEFAIVAPIVFLTILALMQFASLLMSQNLLTNAAREGGRVASLPSTVSANTVELAVKDYCQRGGISGSVVNVAVTPTTLSTAASGDELRVSVSAPLSQMAWIWAITAPNANMPAEVTYKRE